MQDTAVKKYRVNDFNIVMDEFSRNVLINMYGEQGNSQKILKNLVCQVWHDLGSDVIAELRRQLGETSTLVEDKRLFLENFDLFVHLAHKYQYPVSRDRMTIYNIFVNSCVEHIVKRKPLKSIKFWE